ncbi:MAG: tRNA dihydrouridine synthase DusB [Nitrospiraceae bacterium]|nr:MAG: tRNA dihydrouridine synthase DusB [Nitrospiraceae bacterium]
MLSIGNLRLHSPLVLAPMAGISDLPYRMIYRSLGCGLAYTEMISATALAYKSANTLRMLSTNADDRPLGVQIMGREPETIKRALDNISEIGCDLIDFNAACPVKKVASRGKGAGLLQEPLLLQQLLGLIVKHTDLPVTVKIRSGWDETSVNAVEMAVMAQDAGVKGLVIHGRTRQQFYRGGVDYDIIRKVKEALSIPVIASGDALSPELIKKMFDETGCDGVAIARGALGNPWIFRETTGLLEDGSMPPRPDVHEVTETMRIHLNSIVEFLGEKIGIIHFRKFFSWYTKGLSVKELKVRAFVSQTREEMLQLIDEVEKTNKSLSYNSIMKPSLL